jgi:hypothetical protein
MKSPQEGLEQKMRVSQGVLNWRTAFRNLVCSSRESVGLMIALGMGCVQHRGGILDSSVEAWLIMIPKQPEQ